jgi:hypothetical protein
MNPQRYAIAGVAIALVLLGGFALWTQGVIGPGQPPTPSPVASPTQSPTASPTPFSSPSGESQVIDPGTHTTSAFRPAFTYTVPDGWVTERDEPTVWSIKATAAPAWVGACTGTMSAVDNLNVPVPGVGTTAGEVVNYIAARDDITVTQPPTSTIIGNLAAYWMEVTNDTEGELAVVGPGCGFSLDPQESVRFAIAEGFDLKVLVQIGAFEGAESFLEDAMPIVESFEFDLP